MLDFAPGTLIEFGKEYIAFRVGLDAGKVQALGKPNRLFKDLRAADDEEFVLGCGAGDFDARLEAGYDFCIGGMEASVARENDQLAAGHLALCALVGFATHEHMVASGEPAKVLEVVGKMPGELAILANTTAFIQSGK